MRRDGQQIFFTPEEIDVSHFSSPINANQASGYRDMALHIADGRQRLLSSGRLNPDEVQKIKTQLDALLALAGDLAVVSTDVLVADVEDFLRSS